MINEESVTKSTNDYRMFALLTVIVKTVIKYTI